MLEQGTCRCNYVLNALGMKRLLPAGKAHGSKASARPTREERERDSALKTRSIRDWHGHCRCRACFSGDWNGQRNKDEGKTKLEEQRWRVPSTKLARACACGSQNCAGVPQSMCLFTSGQQLHPYDPPRLLLARAVLPLVLPMAALALLQAALPQPRAALLVQPQPPPQHQEGRWLWVRVWLPARTPSALHSTLRETSQPL